MTNDEKIIIHRCGKFLIIDLYYSKIFCIPWHSILRIFHLSKYWRSTELCSFIFLFLSELPFEIYIWSILSSISWFEIVKHIYCPLVMYWLEHRKFDWLQKIYSRRFLIILIFLCNLSVFMIKCYSDHDQTKKIYVKITKWQRFIRILIFSLRRGILTSHRFVIIWSWWSVLLFRLDIILVFLFKQMSPYWMWTRTWHDEI